MYTHTSNVYKQFSIIEILPQPNAKVNNYDLIEFYTITFEEIYKS